MAPYFPFSCIQKPKRGMCMVWGPHSAPLRTPRTAKRSGAQLGVQMLQLAVAATSQARLSGKIQSQSRPRSILSRYGPPKRHCMTLSATTLARDILLVRPLLAFQNPPINMPYGDAEVHLRDDPDFNKHARPNFLRTSTRGSGQFHTDSPCNRVAPTGNIDKEMDNGTRQILGAF